MRGYKMEDIITLCGDNCTYCPRYTAKTEEELNKVAELWYRIGWCNTIVSAEQIKCFGCHSHKVCTYNLVDCVKENDVQKCNQCSKYPCNKISDMLERTDEYKKVCLAKCQEAEYATLAKAFFEKGINLGK